MQGTALRGLGATGGNSPQSSSVCFLIFKLERMFAERMPAKGKWPELAVRLVAFVLGASMCVLVGRFRLLPPLFGSERGQILLPPCHQAGSPNTLTLFPKDLMSPMAGGLQGTPVSLGRFGILAPHRGLSGCLEPSAAGRRGEAREELPGTPRAQRPNMRRPELAASAQVTELKKEIFTSNPALTVTSGHCLATGGYLPGEVRRPGTQEPSCATMPMLTLAALVRPVPENPAHRSRSIPMVPVGP